MIRSASVKELSQWMETDSVVLIDVREPSEWAQGHIDGATLVPLANVPTATLPNHVGKKLVMQCRSGARSRTACGFLTRLYPELDVYNLEGGILGWMEAGNGIEVS